MASNLCHFFSSSALKLTFSHTRSDPLTRSLSNPVSRLICSATQQPHPLEENLNKPQAETNEKDVPNESQEDNQDEDDNYDDSGNFVNRATGEVGGPRGPEPTRFGDWEKNGRLAANAGTLTNFEVLHFLRSKGATKDSTRVLASVAPSEYKVYDYLVKTAACNQTKENIKEFSERCKKFDLAKAEVLNIINMRLSSAVGVYPIIEQCADCFEDVEELVELVTTMLPPPPTQPESEGGKTQPESEGEKTQPEFEGRKTLAESKGEKT